MHAPAANIDFATAFARLLSDPHLRSRYCADAAGLADEFGLADAESPVFWRSMPTTSTGRRRG